MHVLDLLILKEYLSFGIIEVSSKSSLGPSPRAKISFFLLSACTDKLMSTSKATTMLLN